MTADLNTVFFNTDDFAVSAVITINGVAKTIKVIPVNFYQEVNLFGETVQNNSIQFKCMASDIVGLRATRDTIVIDGVDYVIDTPQPDITGITILPVTKVSL